MMSEAPIVGDPRRAPVPGDVRPTADGKALEIFVLVDSVEQWTRIEPTNERERCIRIIREGLAAAAKYGVVCVSADGELAQRIVERIRDA
jgi:hypothetical protein